MPVLLLKVKHLSFPDNVNGGTFVTPFALAFLVICQCYTLWVCGGVFLCVCVCIIAHMSLSACLLFLRPCSLVGLVEVKRVIARRDWEGGIVFHEHVFVQLVVFFPFLPFNHSLFLTRKLHFPSHFSKSTLTNTDTLYVSALFPSVTHKPEQ